MPPADLPVAILAGGLATRLLPSTRTIPKLLVEVAGEPFFNHQLRLLLRSGLRQIVLCVGHLGEQIVQRYGDGSGFGVHITYSFDGPVALGTGGALINALPHLGDAFYVLYGDSYLPIDYRPVAAHFLKSGKLGLMTVFKNAGQYDRSNVQFEGGEIVAYEKQHPTPALQHIDYGLGVYRHTAFVAYPRDQFIDLANIQRALVRDEELVGYEVSERFYEIGSPAGLKELDELLRSPHARPS